MKQRLFITIWLAGFIGIVSFLLVDLGAFLASLPLPADTELPPITLPIKLLTLVQPTIIMSIAVLVGVVLADKVGLLAPVAQAIATGKPLKPALSPQLIPGLVGGLIGGLAIILITTLSIYLLPPAIANRLAGASQLLPFLTRLLYGGITEEVLIRWGLMTLLVWGTWRLFQKGAGKPQPAYFVAAILISSILFGMGHLPYAFLLFPDATTGLILYVIIANSAFGFIAGYLYWRKGLEAAIIAHMVAHVVMFIAN